VFDRWFSAYHGDNLPARLNQLEGNAIVIEGIEQYIKEDCAKLDMHTCRSAWRKMLDDWKIWEESGRNRLLVIIGTDITKGIVPLEQENRDWRDLTGWIFQDISSKADRVDVIWYGLNKQLK
jgi:adenosylcobinamide kinase/adenosylcobinamide-phosphate guanylyltransferase